MESELTDEWIIKTMRLNDWCLNTEVFVYPGGAKKDELNVAEGETVCASVTDVLYLSRQAVFFRDKKGHYIRLPWSEMDDVDWALRKVNGKTVQAIVYKTCGGRKYVVPMPFTFVPSFFGDVHERCIAELTPSGRKCKLPGPARLQSYARPADEASAWAKDIRRDKTVWFRELVCQCDVRKGFTLRYLGRLLGSGLIADGDLRQRITADCTECGESLELFDSYRNGYNAVICHENLDEPPGRDAKTAYRCNCANREFSLGVAAVYDADSEDLTGFRKDKRSEAYGWFSAYATCLACERVTQIID